MQDRPARSLMFRRGGKPTSRQQRSLRRFRAVSRATPKWLTKAQLAQIRAIYAKARSRGLTVDHIEPVQGRLVSGLHIPWNLRIATLEANMSKGNRYSGLKPTSCGPSAGRPLSLYTVVVCCETHSGRRKHTPRTYFGKRTGKRGAPSGKGRLAAPAQSRVSGALSGA